MKFTLIPVLITALSASTALAVNSCGEENSRWTVEVSGVTDVPGICGGLWDNMKRFASCGILEGTSCEDFTGDGDLLWGFTVVSTECNAGCVESAWWEATKNKFGAISCS